MYRAVQLKPGHFLHILGEEGNQTQAGWEGRLEGPAAVAFPGWRGPGPREEPCGGVANGTRCWTPAMGRGLKRPRLRNPPDPGVRGSRKPTAGLDLGLLLSRQMPRSPPPALLGVGGSPHFSISPGFPGDPGFVLFRLALGNQRQRLFPALGFCDSGIRASLGWKSLFHGGLPLLDLEREVTGPDLIASSQPEL